MTGFIIVVSRELEDPDAHGFTPTEPLYAIGPFVDEPLARLYQQMRVSSPDQDTHIVEIRDP